jgi:LmbE family N-acetylglucosaminyl deacetylase
VFTLRHPDADVYVPDSSPIDLALERTTTLAVGAHQDDLEIMAISAIASAYDDPDQWFTGVVCSDGSGSPRSGPYAGVDNQEMSAIRRREQREAADVGCYSAVLQLAYSSPDLRATAESNWVADLTASLAATGARDVFTHNPADRHITHVAVALGVVNAIRSLPSEQRPDRLYGCEAWRSLDWLPEGERLFLSSTGHEVLAHRLLEVFDSQISGGKRYDLATVGRRRANATLADPRAVDTDEQVTLAMDLTPLIRDDTIEVDDYVTGLIDRFRDETRALL